MKQYVNSKRFGEIAHIAVALEARSPMHCRDLVVLVHGTSGDGNPNSRNLVEAIVDVLRDTGMVRFEKSRGRHGLVYMIDKTQLTELSENVHVKDAREHVQRGLRNLDELRDYQRRRRQK